MRGEESEAVRSGRKKRDSRGGPSSGPAPKKRRTAKSDEDGSICEDSCEDRSGEDADSSESGTKHGKKKRGKKATKKGSAKPKKVVGKTKVMLSTKKVKLLCKGCGKTEEASRWSESQCDNRT